MTAEPSQPIGQRGADNRVTVLIASPLEDHHAARIGAAFPGRVETIYRPDLLPPIRFPGDHGGSPAWRRSAAQSAEWYAALAQTEVLWDFPLGETTPLLELAPRLKWVQTTSAGVGQYVQRLGLVETDLLVTTASGIHAQPLTEFVFAALLHHTKRLAHLHAEQRAHHWERFCARELAGQTLAIVGPGRIGRKVAEVARCFGMTVWAMARDHDPDRAVALGVDRLFPREDLHPMLAGADCVVLCAPHTPATDGLLNRAAIAALKPGVVLINIARGAVVDETALIEALQSGQIGLAALDVFQTEPLPADSPLWDLPNVLVCPHSASTADTENAKLTDRFIRNLGFYLDGQLDRMEPVLNKPRLY